VLSLDHDGTGYPQLEDPVVRELGERAEWLRPVLFHSPYECAALSILSARTSRTTAEKLRAALSTDGAFATPEQLLALTELPSLPANKIPRLHGIAEAALEGRLDRERLLAHPDPVTELQTLPGIGPFYANLIYLRAVGPTDAPPPAEPRLHTAVQERYGRPVEDVADGWRPFRTWVSVLIRASA
jgi:DNA-3-methyladenine glycosylase II